MMGHMFEGGYGGNWDNMPEYMQNMMQSYYGGLAPFSSLFGVFQLVTWVLLIAFLIAAIRYLWAKGSKK